MAVSSNTILVKLFLRTNCYLNFSGSRHLSTINIPANPLLFNIKSRKDFNMSSKCSLVPLNIVSSLTSLSSGNKLVSYPLTCEQRCNSTTIYKNSYDMPMPSGNLSHSNCALPSPSCLNFIKNNQFMYQSRSFRCDHISHEKNVAEHDKGDKGKKDGIIKKFKRMWKDYWYVVIPVHVVTSVGWYGGFYLLIKSGVDIPAALEWIGTSEAYVDKLRHSDLGTLALMVVCYKFATPVRYTVTIAGSTWTIRYLSKKGYMTTHELKDELTDRSEQLKRRTKEELYEARLHYRRRTEDLKEEWDRAWQNFAKKKKKG